MVQVGEEVYSGRKSPKSREPQNKPQLKGRAPGPSTERAAGAGLTIEWTARNEVGHSKATRMDAAPRPPAVDAGTTIVQPVV